MYVHLTQSFNFKSLKLKVYEANNMLASKLNPTQNSTYNREMDSELPKWPKPAQILDYVSLKEPAAGLHYNDFGGYCHDV